MNSTEGNCATFLLKVEGVLEGLFQDMIMVGSSEAKVSSVLNLLICDIPDMLHCILPDKSTQICAGEQAPHITRFHRADILRRAWLSRLGRVAHLTSQRTTPRLHLLISTIEVFLTYFLLLLQEKTKKILDIWVKGNTFPSAILARLTDVVKETAKGAYHCSDLFAKYLLCWCNSAQCFGLLMNLVT